MEARARVTSKGQVTVPVEVRRALGVEEGDTLVFEMAGAYATLRKRRPTLEVAEEVRSALPWRSRASGHHEPRGHRGALRVRARVSRRRCPLRERATVRSQNGAPPSVPAGRR